LSQVKKRSPLWYELPLLFSIIGGAIAYFLIKNDDPKRAKNCLYIGIIYLAPLVIVFGLLIIFGFQIPYIVSSGSMIPEMQVFDVATVDYDTPFENIKEGDVIVFYRPSGHDRTILHRVVAIIDDDPYTLRTKGDANPASIPGTDFPITKEEYIGKVDKVIPQIGYMTRILSPPLTDIISVVQLGILIIPVIQHIKFKKEQA